MRCLQCLMVVQPLCVRARNHHWGVPDSHLSRQNSLLHPLHRLWLFTFSIATFSKIFALSAILAFSRSGAIMYPKIYHIAEHQWSLPSKFWQSSSLQQIFHNIWVVSPYHNLVYFTLPIIFTDKSHICKLLFTFQIILKLAASFTSMYKTFS